MRRRERRAGGRRTGKDSWRGRSINVLLLFGFLLSSALEETRVGEKRRSSCGRCEKCKNDKMKKMLRTLLHSNYTISSRWSKLVRVDSVPKWSRFWPVARRL
jgi:hypothetical protein